MHENLNRATSPIDTGYNIGQINNVRLPKCSEYEVRDTEKVDENDSEDEGSELEEDDCYKYDDDSEGSEEESREKEDRYTDDMSDESEYEGSEEESIIIIIL